MTEIIFLLPPFTEETAAKKVRMAEDAWNSRAPEKVARAYTMQSEWRNRDQFIRGRVAIQRFLREKWQIERHYCLIKSLWGWSGNRIAVRFLMNGKMQGDNGGVLMEMKIGSLRLMVKWNGVMPVSMMFVSQKSSDLLFGGMGRGLMISRI